MGSALLMAAADDHLSRAGDHAVVVGIVLLILAAAGLGYWLFRVVGRSRAARSRSDGDPARGPEA